MSEPTKPCPFCGEPILIVAQKCKHCKEYLDPSLRPKPSATDRLLLPVGRPGSAIAAGYCGLFALFPLVGILAGLLAVVLGRKALREIDRDPSLSGKGRAWFGIVVGGLAGLLQLLFVVVLLLNGMKK